MMDITINGQRNIFDVTSLKYEDIIAQAGFERDRIISVTYRSKRSGDTQRSGILSPGNSVEIEDGMIFNAYPTDNA
jgi:hypothetical protein